MMATFMRPFMALSSITKFTPARNMNRITIHWIAVLNDVSESARVPNPPVATVAKLWQMASKGVMPAAQSNTNCEAVRLR